jgi:sterol desaturase/sphingolipid hydroxylase (fatty acid hydroxylase superfamily)
MDCIICKFVQSETGMVNLMLTLNIQMHSGMFYTVPEYPPVKEVLIYFFVSVIASEVVFYYTHRFLHIPWFYKNIHTIHHQVRT